MEVVVMFRVFSSRTSRCR